MWVAVVYRQHNSLVITVPRVLAKKMGVGKGDHIVFDKKEDVEFATFVKLEPGNNITHGKGKDPNRKTKRG